VLLDIALQRWRRIRGKQELALYPAEEIKEFLVILLAVAVIMSEIGIIVRRIAIEKAIRGIPARDHIKCIGTFQLTIAEPFGEYSGKTVPLGIDLSGRGIRTYVKTPAAVKHAAERLGTEYPDGPCPFDSREHVRVVVYYPGLAVQVPAVQACAYLGFERGEVFLGYPVEIDEFPVGIVDDLHFGGALGKEYGGTANEGFTIEGVPWDKGYDACGKLLLAAVIRDRGS